MSIFDLLGIPGQASSRTFLGHGVNLGGWLVTERWITPALYEGVTGKGEYALCEQLGSREAVKRLERHRQRFITEDDIARLAESGLTLIRLPIGYWLFGGEPPFVGGVKYVERLFNWADRYGCRVILDVHGAPGSQNGNDHSGRVGEIGWGDEPNKARTLEFIDRLSARFGHEASLIGVEVLNEPSWEVGLDTLISYYQSAHELIQNNCHSQVRMIVSDAFHPQEMSRALRKAKLHDAVLDVHLYQLFTAEDRALSLEGHIKKVTKEWKPLLRRLRRHHGVLVGEWSGAMSELYDPEAKTPEQYSAEDYARYIQAQQRAFEAAGVAWTYWTARTQDGGVWSLLDHLEFATELK